MPATLNMVELKGSLGRVGLPALVQLIAELHRTGSLELSQGACRGALGFEDGRLVAARYDDQRGLRALAACASELAGGEFMFAEGVTADERTLDLGGSELQQHLSRLARGEVPVETGETGEAPPAIAESGTCPLLGFADDATRHYSRAT
ncbi:MAG: DUF4388 domain-containing protein, partial [Chloroflexota bacterium]